MVTALDKMWHPEHFCCVHCHKELRPPHFVEHTGQPYCKACHNMLFLPPCAGCKRDIQGVCQHKMILKSAKISKGNTNKTFLYFFLLFRIIYSPWAKFGIRTASGVISARAYYLPTTFSSGTESPTVTTVGMTCSRLNATGAKNLSRM